MSASAPGVGLAKKFMTAGEFWEFVHRPENRNRVFELVRGEVIEIPRLGRSRGVITVLVAFALQLYAQATQKGFVVSNGSGIAIGEDPDSVLGPDVAFFTNADKFEDLHPKWGDAPPVLAVEVPPLNDRPEHINAKIREYLANGVKIVWRVDCEVRNVTVYRPKQDMEVIGADGELTGGDDLPGLAIKVADIFKLPGERGPTPPPAPPVA
ncbi:Hypothetical conserved protein OS=uncultured planctomycete GN=HGMM_F09D09C04 PE=4 SV=1: Uma2 [Gemmata massiliana]|uniref:Putative restriction endonuclease domain-containing protein n=1 Tax=Gemmata massiliana TaxID=1210884 RepID=A0A6P2D454_9BACT|nr:Uma2 family endonuclease [Gemmata massiliana]VTR95863.1 Hypothetical conserved protein OS=uncultured planctomycete GN=HGMM_F09D09C04 PE=4 SV=1: Uma2 [Gemmata massiliana]